MFAPAVARRATLGLAAAAVALGALCRLARGATRWDEVALAYAAYLEPAASAIQRGEAAAALSTWVGLHPPLYPVLHGLIERVLPVPALWLWGSAALSLAAVLLCWRAGGPVAGAVLATAPLQLAYAAEVNNYPLAVAAIAAVLAAARARRGLFIAVVAAAMWSHILAGAAALGVLAWRLRWDRGRGWLVLLTVAAGLPIAAGALRLTGVDTTFSQPPLSVGDWTWAAYGAAGLLGTVLALTAAVSARAEALAAGLPLVAVLAFALLSGAAAPHQQQYLVLLGPPGALAVARLAQRLPNALPVLLAGLCLARGLSEAVVIGGQLAEIRSDLQQERGADQAVAQSEPGDALWLVSPALQADDDKSAFAPVLWRFSPWSPMPIARPVPFEYGDWRYGQPRAWRGRTLHTSTELYAGPFDHVAREVIGRGARLWVVVYDHGPATGLLDRIERVLRPYRTTGGALTTMPDRGLGVDHAYRVEGIR